MKIKRKPTQKYERVIFYKREIRKVPTIVEFKRRDGSIARIKTLKRVIVPKKVEFLRKKK